MKERIRVLLAEDQGMVRGALAALLNLEGDFEVIGEAGNGEAALKMIHELKPDLAVLDIEMPKLSGLDVAEELKKENFQCKVVILTTFARSGYLQRSLKAGVKGYLVKDAPVEELAVALRKVYAGERVISPELALAAWEEENPLTEREREILSLSAKGLSSHEIAKRLFLSEGTVRNYLSIAIQKVGAKNRMEAVHISREKGWIEGGL